MPLNQTQPNLLVDLSSFSFSSFFRIAPRAPNMIGIVIIIIIIPQNFSPQASALYI